MLLIKHSQDSNSEMTGSQTKPDLEKIISLSSKGPHVIRDSRVYWETFGIHENRVREANMY